MDDFEWAAILHTPVEGLDQDGSFGVNGNGIEGNFSQSDLNGMLNQEDMQTLSHQNGFWTTNIQEDACAPDVAPQTFDHSSVGDISHLGETPDTMNQNSANGFSNENIHGIGVSTHWFGSGTQVAGLEILDASVYGSSDSELGIFNRTFHQGSFSGSFMAHQQCSNIPIPQLLQQDTISTTNSNGIQSLNNTFSVHGGPSRNGLESFTDHQGFTGDLVPNDSNDCFLLDNIQRGISHFDSIGDLNMGCVHRTSGHTEPAQPHVPVVFSFLPPKPKRKRKKEEGLSEKSTSRKLDWKAWKDLLYDLYIKQSHTAEEVAFELLAIHGLKIAKGAIEKKTLEAGWEDFKKNGNAQNQSQTTQTTEKVARRRKAVALPKTTGSRSFFEMVHRNRNTRPSPIPSISAEPYVHQYRIFHVIDGVGKSTLASKKPWTTNMTEFVPPDGAGDRRSTSWQSVSDKFSNIATLSKTRVGGTVKSLLKDAFMELSKATESRDPSFLIYFWRICVDLSGIRLHSRTYFGEFVFLRVFLRHLRDLFLQSSGNPKDDLVVFLESFFQIVEHTPRDLTVTLGLSCWKTIHMFGDMISHEHPIVLNLGSFCTKHWKSKFKVDEDKLDLKYKSLFDSMNRRDCSGDAEEQEKISILYDHIYALSKLKYISGTDARRVNLLRTLTVTQLKKDEEKLKYTITTRAFAFSSELLALYNLETWKTEKTEHIHDRKQAFDYMIEAIETLRHGDLECKLKAAHLSKRLGVWYKSYCPGGKLMSKSNRAKGKEVEAEKKRTREILSQIQKEPVLMDGDRHIFGNKRASKNTRWRRKQTAERDCFLFSISKAGKIDRPS